MKTADEILAEHGIKPPLGKFSDNFYTTCPHCSASRSPAHREANCLHVTITKDGVVWFCNHCPWRGGETFKANGRDQGREEFIAVYYYPDDTGVVKARKVRPRSGKPKCFWQHLNHQDEWVKTKGDAPRLLYRLPELHEALANEHPVLIVEGEKDVDSAYRIGLPATCNPDGATGEKWRRADSEVLRGADIVIIPDHDEEGYKHANLIAQTSRGIAKRVRMLALAKHWPECPKGGDISDWLAAGHTREELDALIERAPDYSKDTSEDPSAPEQLPPLPYINMSNWDNEPVPQQEWSVLNRIPRYQTTLFSGEGAIGKSTIELHRACAHVLGRDWLGTMPESGPAIFIDAEDHRDVLHRRLAAIIRHYKISFADLIRDGLHLISLVGEDAVLATASRSGKIEPTLLYKQILEAAGDIKPATIGIASSANVFAGNENDRNQVQQFIGLLTRLAILSTGSVNLISHPSLTGITTETGMSGSTQWHNAVRARMFLRGMKPAADEQPQGDLREIIFKKNQYGPISENIVLQYRDGMFLPAPAKTSLDQAAQEAKADEKFCTNIIRFTGQGRNVSVKPSAPTYAPTEFAKEPEAKKFGLKKADFEAAMHRLLDAGKIWNEPYGPPSRGWTRLRVVEPK